MLPRILPALAALVALAASEEVAGEESCQSDILLQAQHNRISALSEPVEETDLPPRELAEREPTALLGEEEEAGLLETEEETEESKAECDRVVKRFVELDKQDLTGGSDPLFPANMDSITATGGECGDSAQNIKENCGTYNHWATFEKLAESRGKQVDVMGKNLDYDDVAQGALGTCYFLAAMASIAHSDPKAIQRMFVSRDKWAKGVYTTRWMIDGRVGDVEVNNEIPAKGTKPAPFFVRPGPDYESFWPMILEKAYAKIFGDFKFIEGGVWDNAVQAMTMAPVVSLSHKKMGKEGVWAALKEATANGWPMGCHTSEDAPKVGLATGHAYSTLNASVHPKYGRVLTCFNPWNADYYKGVIPNSQKSDGVFTITLDEYMMAFGTSMYAKVEDDYELVSKQIVQDKEKTQLSAWEFSITGNKPFFVTLSWPGWREVRPCKLHRPSPSLKVLRKDTKEVVAEAPPPAGTFAVTSIAAEVTAGAGEYIAVTGLSFKEDEALDGHLIVNSEVATSIKASTFDPVSLFVPADEQGNFCPVVTVAGDTYILQADKKVGGIPVYETVNKLYFLYWYGPINKWAKLNSEKLPELMAGKGLGLRYLGYPKSDFSCGCKDRATGVTAFGKKWQTPCDQVRDDNAKHGWLTCTKKKKVAEEACPLTCGAAHCQAATPKPTPAPTPAPPPPAPQPVHPPAGCTDSTTYKDPTYGDNCAGWAAYSCTGYSFSDKLIAACPKSCKSCKHSPAPAPPPPPPATCTDSTTYKDPQWGDDCAAWGSYDCNGYDYSSALIAACPKACKTC